MPSRGDPLSQHEDIQLTESLHGESTSRPLSGQWSDVKRSRGTSKAPSQTSSVHLQRVHSIHGAEGEVMRRLASVSNTAQPVLITQPPDEDDDGHLDEEAMFGASTPSLDGHARLRAALPSSDDDDDDDDMSDSDYGHMGVDIDNPEAYDTDLEIDGEEWLRDSEEFDGAGIKDYIRECNRCGVLPVSYFQRHIHDKHFVMRHHGLGPLGAKAIAKPLERNTFIERLDLEGNSIEGTGATHLAKVLKDNLYINHLVLSENNLRSQGAQSICEMLMDNTTVSELNLSGNNLKDSDGRYFHDLLLHNSTLKTLHLNHNHFETDGARWFRDALVHNENLKMLDLSWNHFRMKGAQFLAEMIMENYGLKYLNLAMNGLGTEGAKSIGHGLAHNQCILELNLMSNRITKTGAIHISKGLLVNDVLETLRIGMNPIQTEGALVIIAAIDKNEESVIHMLDLTNIIVCEKFEELQEKIREEDHRMLKVIHGGVLFKSKYVTLPVEDPEAAFQRDPMTKLKKYAEQKKLRLVDLFKQFDKNNSWSVDREEFLMGIQSTGIDMTEDEIDILISRLDKDGDGEIDYGELVDGDQQHRQQKRKINEKLKEKERKQKEDELNPYNLLTPEEALLATVLTPVEV